MSFNRKRSGRSALKLGGFFLIIIMAFLTISLRLFQLSVVKGTYYRNLSENNRMREVVIEAKRGSIVDRKGMTLANNITLENESENSRVYSRRIYNDPESIAHVLGYRQTADATDIKNDPCIYKLVPGDKVGKKSIEKAYECELRGKRGKKLIEVNAKGSYLRTLSVSSPVDGKTIQVSIDQYLQSKAYEIIKGQRAVVVAAIPDTGEIITLVSSPSYNIQFFEDEVTEETKKYIVDKEKPLFDRATEGTYPPGSTFKLVVAAAALEEGAINETTTIEDTGKILAGTQSFGNWFYLEHGKTEGLVDIVTAIKRSNDIFFYKTGEKLGPTKIKRWSEIFGYGKNNDLPINESEGIIPFPFWKEEKLKEKWFLGDTYNLSIGQGYLNVTPLQVARMTNVIASDGYLCKPTLLKIGSYLGPANRDCEKTPLTAKTISLIKKGMVDACSAGGTGWPFFHFDVHEASGEAKTKPIQVACKTGTAESHAESGKPHAWFTTYAPADKPEIAVTVLVEDSGQGSDIAAPIAKSFLTYYFERQE